MAPGRTCMSSVLLAASTCLRIAFLSIVNVYLLTTLTQWDNNIDIHLMDTQRIHSLCHMGYFTHPVFKKNE